MLIWKGAPDRFRLINEEILDGMNELALIVGSKLIDDVESDAKGVWQNVDLCCNSLFDYVPFTRLPHGAQTADALIRRNPDIFNAWSLVTDHLCVMPELGPVEFKLHEAEYDPPYCILEHLWRHWSPPVSG